MTTDETDRGVEGRTNWKRFAALVVPGIAGVAALGIAMGEGVLASSFAVSGQQFRVSADSLDGTGFVQYGWIDGDAHNDPHPVAVSAMKTATLVNLCQSVVTEFPILGAVSLNISAGGDGDPVLATDLFVDATQLSGDAEFKRIEIGRDASTLDKGPEGAQGFTDMFAQQADTVHIEDLRQVAWATNAATFTLKDMSLKVNAGRHECPGPE